MKKLIAVLVVFMLIGTVVFAQENTGFKVGGWGRAALFPLRLVKPDTGDLEAYAAGAGGNWKPSPELRVSFSAGSDNIGVQLDASFYDGFAGQAPFSAEQAHVWAKPFDFLTVRVGRFNVDNLRGKIGDTAFPNYLLGMKGADAIFKRFGNATGGIVELTPIDNLFVAATLYGQGGNNTTLKAEDVYKEIQVGAGYTLENLGQVRAQYIGAANTYAGGSPGVAAKEGIYVTPSTTPGAVGTQGVGFQLPTTGNPYWIVEPVKAGDATSSSIAGHRIQAAFALTAIDNLTVDLGGTIGLPFDVEDMTDVTANQGHGISLGANFAAGDFSVLGRADTTFGANAKYKSDKMYTSGFGLNALIEPSYNLGAVTVGADINLDFAGNSKVGMGSLVENKDGHFGFGFGLWLKKGLSNGYIQTGVALTLPQNNKDDTKGPLVVAIPIVLEYGF